MILGFNFIAERDVTKSISNLSLLLGAALIVVVVFFFIFLFGSHKVCWFNQDPVVVGTWNLEGSN